MSEENQTQAVTRVKNTDREMTYVPVGGVDSIKLTIKIVQTLLCKPTKSGKVCSEQDAMKFMMKCQAMRLNPFNEDVFITGYDTKNGPEFSTITAHKAFINRAESHPEYDGFDSGVIVQDKESEELLFLEGDFYLPKKQELLGGWCTVYFKNRSHPIKSRLNLNSRMPTYSDGDTNKFWKTDPGGQICKCSEVDALRRAFPSLLGGLYTKEEMFSVRGDAVDVSAGLVSVVSAPARQLADPDQVPGAEAPPKPKPDAKAALQAIVEEGGFTFDTFREWAAMEEQLKDADSVGGWDEVPTDVASRLVRAKVGLLNGLAAMKGVAK